MSDTPFIGRDEELAQLKDLLKKRTASLVAVKGRRRVGKSRLVEEFAKGMKFYKFTGLAPQEGVKAEDQRNEFARKLQEQTGLPRLKTEDWADLFSLLAREVTKGRVIILFDEISWMAMDDPTFLPKLKNVWEDNFKKNSKLILFLCSSVSMWFEENILNSTAFFGRISWELQLEPLPLSDSNKMLEAHGFKSSSSEKFKILSVTGGIPWYIEQIKGQYSADENIKQQCFTRGGILVEEFDKIFHDLFEKKDYIYKKIILSLQDGAMDYDTISKQLEYSKSGRLTQYLTNLVKAGFISEDKTWSLRTGKALALSQYRLSDNYIRFYLNYIAPRKDLIASKRMKALTLSSLPGWETIMGLQFENLVVNNRHALYSLLNIAPDAVIYDGPFFQRKTSRQKGCQIDFLIQTKFNTLYVVEVKFLMREVKYSVIEEVQEKIRKISLPRGVAVLPVLIHVNGVSKKIMDADYFHAIIDFSEAILK